MKKVWDQSDFRKLFQIANDEKESKKLFVQCMNKTENNEFIIDEIKETLHHDYSNFLDLMSEIYQDLESDIKNELIQWIIENSEFTDEYALYHELDTYHFFITTVSRLSDYMNLMTSQVAIGSIQNSHHIEDVTRYLLAKYYYQNKANKDDFIYQKNDHGKVMRHMINDYFQQETGYLLAIAKQNYQSELELQKQNRDKKIDKLVMKTYKKLNRLINSLKDPQLMIAELTQLKTESFQKLSTYTSHDYQQYSSILTLQSAIDEHLTHYQTLIQNQQPLSISHNHQEPIINQQDLEIIEWFYKENHLYYKKTQIIQELQDHPFVIEFYQFYNDIQQLEDKEETVNKLEELISDIRESGLKNKEILRRLLSVSKKKIEDFIENEQDNCVDEEDVSINVEDSHETIKIGKFNVLKESVQDNPVDIQKIVHLLAPSDHQQLDWLKSLVYQIGYDKVNAYLLKSPGMTLHDLQVIMKLDRSLRFEYQRILEDIEMYFRSTFTYFLSNRYDQKYLMEETYQPFYKRGYLIGNLFSDYQDHYEQVKLLHDRIDDEMKNNNLQVIEEYQRYKYALPFSTAAGIMTFGWIINLFENLNYYDKSEYLRTYFYHLTPQTFCSWMMSLSNLRNRCAHYQSLYRLSSLKELRPIMTKDVDANGYDDDLKHSSLFYYTLIMTRLSPDMSNIEDFIDDVGILIRKANRESNAFDFQKDYSFPKTWRTILENEKSSKMNLNGKLV
ncbi:Abi family protein [Candidatus Stoquefichus massiliensis]|uniref:Abi family protein n=1 Tax=Candidatus Stoquefichus massiliensis TaxID=1470350 RepID=UPI00047F4BF7|nr:Abi family protein [Candidatus Stoquefichus massiliensis]